MTDPLLVYHRSSKSAHTQETNYLFRIKKTTEAAVALVAIITHLTWKINAKRRFCYFCANECNSPCR